MTATPFTQLQASVNSTVLATMANAEAEIYGVKHPVIYDEPYSRGDVGSMMGGMGGMASSQPSVTMASAAVPTDYDGVDITVDGRPYVISHVQPDGMGLSTVYLGSTA